MATQARRQAKPFSSADQAHQAAAAHTDQRARPRTGSETLVMHRASDQGRGARNAVESAVYFGSFVLFWRRGQYNPLKALPCMSHYHP
mgnify:CR=1 FL=1